MNELLRHVHGNKKKYKSSKKLISNYWAFKNSLLEVIVKSEAREENLSR